MERLFLIVVLERCRYGYNDPTRKPRKNVLALSGPCYLCLSVHRRVPRLSPTLFLLIPFVHRRQPTFSHLRRREVNEIRVQVRKKGKERKKEKERKEWVEKRKVFPLWWWWWWTKVRKGRKKERDQGESYRGGDWKWWRKRRTRGRMVSGTTAEKSPQWRISMVGQCRERVRTEISYREECFIVEWEIKWIRGWLKERGEVKMGRLMRIHW